MVKTEKEVFQNQKQLETSFITQSFFSTNIFRTRTHLSFLSQIIANAVVYINLAFVQIRTFV